MTEQSRLTKTERIIVAGSRTIQSDRVVEQRISRVLEGKPQSTVPVFVTGDAKGVDQSAQVFADTFNFEHRLFEAEWETYGKAAGPKRNREMADFADTLIAIWDGSSRGTESMIEEALKAGLEIHIFQLPRENDAE